MQGHLSAAQSPSEKGQRHRLCSDRSSSEEVNMLDLDESHVDHLHVPDGEFYNLDKEQTDELIDPGQVCSQHCLT